jgi:peptidyl-tRNA hydrolase
VEELGSESFLYATVEVDGVPQTLAVRDTSHGKIAPGSRVGLRIRPDAAHVFDGATGDRLGD